MHIVLFFHSLWGHAALNVAMVAIAKYGIAISIAAFIVGFARRRPTGLIPWLAVGIVTAVGFNLLAGHLLFNPRPFVYLNVTPLFPHPPDNGFPSDHSAVAAFIAAALWFIDVPAAAVATLAAVAIGVARMYSAVHWPIDVIAGWAIGAIPALIAMRMWRRQNG